MWQFFKIIGRINIICDAVSGQPRIVRVALMMSLNLLEGTSGKPLNLTLQESTSISRVRIVATSYFRAETREEEESSGRVVDYGEGVGVCIQCRIREERVNGLKTRSKTDINKGKATA